MGEVYIVEQAFLGRRFALKIIKPQHGDNHRFADRMRIEAQAAARLNHPNIVQVIDFWIAADHRPCMVMELLSGRTLSAELVERRRLPLAEALALTGQMLSALGAAHDLGIVHRDIKPENLFLHQPVDHPRVLKVLDFGIARVLPSAPHLAPKPLDVPTKTGTFLGSPRFASPETVHGEHVDQRADLYSVGLVLYIMLTGRGAFDRMRPDEDWATYGIEPPSRHLGSEATPGLDAIIMKSLSYDKAKRFQTAGEFAASLLESSEASDA
jgi:serine/threonine-protein kinase